MNRHQIKDAAALASGQIAAALGALVGVRLLTEILAPSEFGMVTLALGVSALCIGVFVNPVAQGIIHFFAASSVSGRLDNLRRAVLQSARRSAPWSVAVLGLAVLLLPNQAGQSRWPLFLALVILTVCDGLRSYGLAWLNASQRHRRYAAWLAIDAWARPLLSVALLLLTGADGRVVVGAHAMVSIALLWFAYGLVREFPAGWRDARREDSSEMLWRYALPLVPMGLIGWANSLGDRYLIGALLTVAEAGLYAAAYGLASRPFMMAFSTVELTMRPLYQNAVSSSDIPATRRILGRWLILVVGIGALGTLLFSLLAGFAAQIFLGDSYRPIATTLMPWIAAGYALQGIAQVFERVCYAYGDTRSVLAILTVTAVAAAAAISIGILQLGLLGAAVAVPVYFLVELLVAVCFARRWLVQAGVALGRESA